MLRIIEEKQIQEFLWDRTNKESTDSVDSLFVKNQLPLDLDLQVF